MEAEEHNNDEWLELRSRQYDGHHGRLGVVALVGDFH
jgi:hypothetical protein